MDDEDGGREVPKDDENADQETPGGVSITGDETEQPRSVGQAPGSPAGKETFGEKSEATLEDEQTTLQSPETKDTEEVNEAVIDTEETEGKMAEEFETGTGSEKPNAETDDKVISGEESEDERKEEGTDIEAQKGKRKTFEKKLTIPNDFFYKYEDMMSTAKISEDSGLPQDMLTLIWSFGYDCTKRSNIHVLNEFAILFAAGNLVVLLDVKTKEQWYLRSSGGGGINAIAVHPSSNYFASAESGQAPNINVFEYPSLKLHRILRGGTEKIYTFVNFSPDGTLLASQGGDPDFMLTLWNWKEELIILRCKAFSQDIYRVTFSTELEGQLTTAGMGHIKFWKMADTFTGLKLQGEIGKFGKTEISDIEGCVELPDGKVVSGCEWGNLMLWDGELIKVEITRRNQKPCHIGPIMQILFVEGELMTVGQDGYIRVWNFEVIDTAEASDESGMFEMEPMNELKVGHDVKLMCIDDAIIEDESPVWFAQDANGGIWKLDLSFSHTSHSPQKLFTFHAGPIAGCDVCPIAHLVATTGKDQTVRIFDILSKKQLNETKFSASGTVILWAPLTIDLKGLTIYVGFADGIVRVLTIEKTNKEISRREKNECTLILKQVLKPHNSAVTALSVNDTGELMATGSKDSTIFFMSVNTNLEPIGFIKTQTPVCSFIWSPSHFSKKTLLVFCEDGYTIEVESPVKGKFDTSKSYMISGLSIKSYKFTSIKSVIRHEEELERKRIEEEERKRIEEEERQMRIERGLETESEEGGEGDEDEEEAKKAEEKEEEWTPYIPEEPSPILCGFYGQEEGTFWLSLGEFDAGYIYECCFLSDGEKSKMQPEDIDKPLRAVPVVDSNDVPVTKIIFSKSGDQMLMGMASGVIRIHQLEESTFGPYWMLNMHDNNYGAITGLSITFDKKFLVSVGADGNFFLYKFMEEEELKGKIAEAKAMIPEAKPDKEKVDDIEDRHAYSIENAKQKLEYDRLISMAEAKKMAVRSKIAILQKKFKTQLEMNRSLDSHLQLDQKIFEIDSEVREGLKKQIEDKVQLVKREMEWIAEKHRLALGKLQGRFKNMVECDFIVVRSFHSSYTVSSFRAPSLPDNFYVMKALYESQKGTAAGKELTQRENIDSEVFRRLPAVDSETTLGQSDTKIDFQLKGSRGERIMKSLQKVEEKKRLRAIRRSQWEECYRSRPADDYEDPLDVAAIKEAKENMGDFKLKIAPDYVVPDHLRMNVIKAKLKLLTLEEEIHNKKYQFNVSLIELRDKKIAVIDRVSWLKKEITEIQAKLDPNKHKQAPELPELSPEEVPEKKLDYTQEMLLKFQKEQEQTELAALVKDNEKFGNFGLADKSVKQQVSTSSFSMKSSMVSTGKPDTPPEVYFLNVTEDGKAKPSLLKMQLDQEEEIRLIDKRDRILDEIQLLLRKFDAELRVLRHRKFELDVSLKNADLRQVTLYEELVLLGEYEKQENILALKVTEKDKEAVEIQSKVEECKIKLENKKKDIEKLQEKERALHTMFLSSVGDNKFLDYLTKVFKKRIKRSKKKETETSDEDSDTSSDESDWSESDEESESDGVGYDLDICPSACDQTFYDNTCQLREKRLDIEEELVEEKKVHEALKKERENIQKKEKIINSALQMAENELEAFQVEKQRKLNELDVIVTLFLHQIQYIINGVMPLNLSSALVFEAAQVSQLYQRIKELQQEKEQQKKKMRDERHKHIQLVRDRRVFEKAVEEMLEKCNQMMIDKFGKIVDMEILETVTVNKSLEELKEKLRITEDSYEKEMQVWEKKIDTAKETITDIIRKNTFHVDQLYSLLEDKKDLEASLDSRQTNLGEEYKHQPKKTEVQERQRLIQLVHLQAQEIEALKEEIILLSRKGGHILPPVEPCPQPEFLQ